jgi:Carboxylesterase family
MPSFVHLSPKWKLIIFNLISVSFRLFQLLIICFNKTRVSNQIYFILSFKFVVKSLKMSSSEFVVVETEHGPVKGTKKSSVLGIDYFNFQGISYMKAPVGKLRFRDAEKPEKWIEPLDASRELCYPLFDFFGKKFDGQEDAGIVNVFTKSVQPEKKFPVMVWVKETTVEYFRKFYILLC